MKKMPIQTVLTGDIVNSTQLNAITEKRLLKVLHKILDAYKFEFYRGDSFQVYIKKPESSLRVGLLCRTAALQVTQKEAISSADVRISIGIGEVITPVRSLGSAKGEAFILSGRSFDAIQKTKTRLSIISSNELANVGLQVIADYINSIYAGMTPKQAEVIFKLLAGQAQLTIAEALNKSKSTISQLAHAGRWAEIESLLEQYENIINKLI